MITLSGTGGHGMSGCNRFVISSPYLNAGINNFENATGEARTLDRDEACLRQICFRKNFFAVVDPRMVLLHLRAPIR
jgi:hypothetical protein